MRGILRAGLWGLAIVLLLVGAAGAFAVSLHHRARNALTTGVMRALSQLVTRWPHVLATESVSACTYFAKATADSALTLWSSHE